MTNNPYDRLPGSDTSVGRSDMPSMPPSYDDANEGGNSNGSNTVWEHNDTNEGNADHINMEQFDIDDEDFETNIERKNILARASFLTKKFATGFSNRVITPVSRIIDPIYEGLSFVNSQYESSILKIGNPLVVKRLLYVAFMIGIIFFVTKYSTNEGVNGVSGGAFSSGKFYDIEKLADIISDHIDEGTMKETLEYFSSMPHLPGTEGDAALARYVETYMKNNGVQDVKTLEFHSFVNYPASKDKKSTVRTSDGSFEATLNEMGKDETHYYGFNPDTMNAESEIEGHMIYASQGTEADFKNLENAGVELKDSVLLIKYGGNTEEAIKLQMAIARQAKAVVFISPKFSTGKDDTKKDHDDVIQRIDVAYSRYTTGDAMEDGSTSPWYRSKTHAHIPTIPISYKDGQTLISKLGDKGFKFDDHSYSGELTQDADKKLKITVKDDGALRESWNVIGSISGREQNDKRVIIGAARDSACSGTIESSTGTAILLELVKIFTTMQRKFNWSPARSITFVSFDATNYNMAGATAFINRNKENIKNEAYTYIDLSDAVAGDELSIKANPFLHKLIRDCLKKVGSSTIQVRDGGKLPKVHHKDKSMSLYDLYKLSHKGSDTISNNMIEAKNYVPFTNTLNVPSVEIKFQGYNYPSKSCYDNFENFEAAKIDPTMKKHSQLVELLGRLILHVVEEAVIPFNFGEFAKTLADYQADLEKYADEKIRADNKPQKPQMHYDKLTHALNTLRGSADQFDNWVDSWKQFIVQAADMESSLLAMKRWKWNQCLVEFNNQFINSKSPHGRPGYLNSMFGIARNAPVVDDGTWQWNTFPMIRDFIDRGDYGRAQYEIDRFAAVLEHSAVAFSRY